MIEFEKQLITASDKDRLKKMLESNYAVAIEATESNGDLRIILREMVAYDNRLDHDVYLLLQKV